MQHDVAVLACWPHEPRLGDIKCTCVRVCCVTLIWCDVVAVMWFVLCVQLSAGLD